jgi:hypothetical protein
MPELKIKVPRPELYEILDPGHVTAMQWCPDDAAATGALVGWMIAADLEFSHPFAAGTSTTLAIHCDECQAPHRAEPGDWVIQGVTDHWFTWPDAEFDANYRLVTFLDPPAPATSELSPVPPKGER